MPVNVHLEFHNVSPEFLDMIHRWMATGNEPDFAPQKPELTSAAKALPQGIIEGEFIDE